MRFCPTACSMMGPQITSQQSISLHSVRSQLRLTQLLTRPSQYGIRASSLIAVDFHLVLAFPIPHSQGYSMLVMQLSCEGARGNDALGSIGMALISE